MSNDLEVNITKVIPAPQKEVFQAWLNPEMLAKFMMPGPGMSVPKAKTEACVGGKFLIVMKAGDKELPHSGEYKEITEYQKIAFTWVSPHSTVESLVTLTFTEISAAQTELNLRHIGFSDEESRKSHEGGWGGILEVLATVAG